LMVHPMLVSQIKSNTQEYIGAYRGTVLTDEEWESTSRAQSEFAFVINDGANGVVIDGQSGCAVNELKFINHSCEPNAVMKEVYVAGMWHVAVIALRDIGQGEELVHDYALITEDEDSPEAQIACTCGADKCRGTLFRIVDF
jgi:SET domain-containing protein